MNPQPLRKSRKYKHELYAQARAKAAAPRVACAEAGLNPINAYRTENLPKVQQRIRELREVGDLDISRQRRILRDELTRIAFGRLPDLFTEDDKGNRSLLPLSEWTDDERAAIAEIWTDKDGTERVRAHSKLTAIDLLMKLDGLVDPDVIALQLNTQIVNGVPRNERPTISVSWKSPDTSTPA
jgi:hypothetical protein